MADGARITSKSDQYPAVSVVCPADMQIRVRYEAKMDEQEKKERKKKRDRLQRRYDEQLRNE